LFGTEKSSGAWWFLDRLGKESQKEIKTFAFE
jgi:hypothetical protein